MLKVHMNHLYWKWKNVLKLWKPLHEKNVELTDVELDPIKNYVLQNCNEVSPFIELVILLNCTCILSWLCNFSSDYTNM